MRIMWQNCYIHGLSECSYKTTHEVDKSGINPNCRHGLYGCDFCGKTFKTKDLHTSYGGKSGTNLNKRPNGCGLCGKAFTAKD